MTANLAPWLRSTTGFASPRVIYGTAWKRERTRELVTLALTQGFRGLDTACQPKHYDEGGVGDGIALAGVAREELYVQSKFTPLAGQDLARVPYALDAPIAEQVEQSCQASLGNLRLDRLDTLILHSPLASRAQTLAAWRALEAQVAAGRVRHLGLSNCYALAEIDALWRAASVKPVILQNRFHARTRFDRDLRAFCREHGLSYQSFWTLTANPELLATTTVRRLAARYRRTPEQILLRYLTQIDIVPLTGTASLAHMRDDLAIFEFTLDGNECAAMALLM